MPCAPRVADSQADNPDVPPNPGGFPPMVVCGPGLPVVPDVKHKPPLVSRVRQAARMVACFRGAGDGDGLAQVICAFCDWCLTGQFRLAIYRAIPITTAGTLTGLTGVFHDFKLLPPGTGPLSSRSRADLPGVIG